MNKNKSKASKIFQVALFALTLGLLAYFCISDNNLMILLYSFHGLNFFWLSLGAGCVVLSWLMDGLVTKLLISAAYDEDYEFRHAFKVTMVGQYFNSITPFAVAGQPMQFLTLTRQGVSSGIALSALVRKYLVYQTTIAGYSLFVILVKYSFFRSRIQGFMALAVIGFLYQSAVVVLLFLFAHSPRFTTKLIEGCVKLLTKIHIVKKPQEAGEKVKNQLEFYIENNKAMQGNRLMKARIYGYTVVELTAVFAVPFFIYKAFHNPGAPFMDMIAAQSFVTMISAYTPLPGAAGAAEGSFLVLFQLFFQPNVIRQAMLLWRFITYYSCIIVGAFFAGLENKAQKREPGFRKDAVQPPVEESGTGPNQPDWKPS
ncbi:lysylphosphatidylglycerol synthase transmembrane domain-containing protein [Caproiciproducens galactitolivorans]|uniref:Phosphatidylglycerol lysyltransferase n=1 Tax=Caproiciproducens galactitolivorans TaxID=642589 RepID=A0ABT4BTD1_9FIRM|nr:lysylphosphatidylglycerol synthase transmembrane domain-containing protein [Caproiciproducens galactitolivorans]MCY1713333.1 lysylphosphatidylglycerol synthase transmembrane domain-containing protein [Caproiciproducens galactitolivorans]